MSGTTLVPFPVAPDLGAEYGLAETDQRHRAVFNGIWQVGYGFQVSGLYFFGSGERLATTCGGDRRGWARGGTARLCADGSIVERNSFVRDAIHRLDMRLQQRMPVGNRVQVDGIFELFNVFNRDNFGRTRPTAAARATASRTRARTSRSRRGRCSSASG